MSPPPPRPTSEPPPADELARDGELAIRIMRDDPADYALMERWLNDERVKPYWEGRDQSFPMERILEKYGPRARGDGKVTPCVLTLSGEPIGYIQFYRTDDWIEWRDQMGMEPHPDRWGLDIVIGEPELWDKGLGTRAVGSLLGYLFDERGASEVVLDPLASNARAIRSYQKAGFEKVRLVPNSEFHEGEWRDAWLMSATRPAGRA